MGKLINSAAARPVHLQQSRRWNRRGNAALPSARDKMADKKCCWECCSSQCPCSKSHLFHRRLCSAGRPLLALVIQPADNSKRPARRAGTEFI